jgi:hypothetical protein
MSDFLDLPAGIVISIPLTYKDRIEAVCLDEHHCTIANAIYRTGRRLGIVTLGRHGASRTMVRMILDPKVFPWAVQGQEYRGRFSEASAAVAAELDEWYDKPVQHQAFKDSLAAQGTPRRPWGIITITAPKASQAKGYRTGSAGTQPFGSPPKPAVPGVPPRRYNGFPRRLAPKLKAKP